jgi:major membrane immunogen (membrane-anchored lipoprotein)
MKKIIGLTGIILTSILFTFNSCVKEPPVDNSGGSGSGGGSGGGGGTGGGGGGGGATTGQVTFWTASDLGCGTITVVCNGISKIISGYFPSGAPACGASGAATFDLNPGTYAFTASCSGKNWSGTITITAGACTMAQLTNSGGGGGGGITTGQGIFWTKTNFGCGVINVTLNGVTRTVSSYYSSVPACGASGCANYTLNPGTYSFTASCSGRTWSGTIVIIVGGCAHVELT